MPDSFVATSGNQWIIPNITFIGSVLSANRRKAWVISNLKPNIMETLLSGLSTGPIIGNIPNINVIIYVKE